MENQSASKICGVRLRSQITKEIRDIREIPENDAEKKPKVTTRNKSGNVANLSIKRESSDEDFKEYAETAMNELLGWYGYGSNNNNNNKEMAKKLSKKLHTIDESDKTEKLEKNLQLVESRRSSANSSGSESPKTADMCAWCGKTVDDSAGLSSNDAFFCSELCFSQSRRANFKKNKTCDWCKHVRHTVSYVDFQDGASQLQFCSDKCLNQYKMHIFCRETRAHLEMHPHLLTEDTTSGLITPDLWMRNCRSPGSRTSSPVFANIINPNPNQNSNLSITSKVEELQHQTSPLPLITVAHPSKLLSVPIPDSKATLSTTPSTHSRRKRTRKRLPQPLNLNLNLPVHKMAHLDVAQDLRIRRNTNFSDNGNGNKTFPELASRLCNSNGKLNGNSPKDAAQSQLLQSQVRSRGLPINGNGVINSVPSLDGMNYQFSQHLSELLPNSLQTPSVNAIPAMSRGLNTSSLMPPVTVMVPYPVLLPVPVPIPIPLPLSSFLHVANLRERDAQQNGVSNQNGEVKKHDGAAGNSTDVGLQSKIEEDLDDEEIVVDDDSRLNVVHVVDSDIVECVNTNDDELSIDSNDKNGGDETVDEFVPIRLRKRKQPESNGCINEGVNYKHKKSLSV